jgi:rhodanese-related sulfurtransferase
VIAESYRRVIWYPDGIEAWQNAGLPTAVVEAEGPGVQ